MKAKKSVAASTYPEGEVIGSSNNQWRIGKKIGSGACGSVHELSNVTNKAAHHDYVIKVALQDKKKTKKKTQMQRMEDLLHFECLQYNNILPHLKGKFIPDVPLPNVSGCPPCYSKEEGFSFLVMERMEAPLFDVISFIIEDAKKKKGASKLFSDVVVSMISCIEAIHKCRRLFVDVKAENFMLAYSSSKNTDLGDRVRMIDFGLLNTFREDTYPNCTFEGTPKYASINVLEGHTPSRRDDLEAVGYVTAELLLHILHPASSARSLPWSGAQSDEDVLRIKRSEVDGKKTSFFAQMATKGNVEAERTMKEYFKIVRKLEFAAAPDYEALKRLFRRLTLHLGKTDKAVPAEKRQRLKPINNKDLKRVQNDPPSSPSPKKKTATRTNKNTKKEVIDVDGDDNDNDAKNAPRRSPRNKRGNRRNAVQNTEDDDNAHVEPAVKSKRKNQPKDANKQEAPPDDQCQFRAVFETGPHKGESFGINDVPVILGRNPTTYTSKKRNKNYSFFETCNDEEISSTHASFCVKSSSSGRSRVFSVLVEDLDSTNGTVVNKNKLKSGGSKQVFAGDRIVMGRSLIEIKKV